MDRIDLTREPLRYPGPPATAPMLVLAHCRHRVTPVPGRPLGAARVTRCDACAAGPGLRETTLDEELRARAAVPMAQRVPVVAVGSNACPAVLRTKLDRTGPEPVVPLFPAELRNLRIGVSAHVSRPGFLPAAPVRADGARARVVLGWPDRDQLPQLDRTEPNYRRKTLSGIDYPLILDDGDGSGRGSGFELYESRWGVLTDPADPADPWPLTGQDELFGRLAALGLEPWRSLRPADAARRLAASEELRIGLRDHFRAAGMTRDSGL